VGSLFLLRGLAHTLRAVTLADNPFVRKYTAASPASHALFRSADFELGPFVVSVLPSLHTIDGRDVNPADRVTGRALFHDTHGDAASWSLSHPPQATWTHAPRTCWRRTAATACSSTSAPSCRVGARC
jgi:hypothetical protein